MKTCNKCKQTLPSTQEFFHKAEGRGRKPGALLAICKKCTSKRNKEYNTRNLRLNQEKRIKKVYGLEWSEYEAMVAKGCAICGKHGDPHVDHDHATGAVRGILCHGCNVSLGQFNDDIATLEKAIAYLKGER